jgi:hypothetical protein
MRTEQSLKNLLQITTKWVLLLSLVLVQFLIIMTENKQINRKLNEKYMNHDEELTMQKSMKSNFNFDSIMLK